MKRITQLLILSATAIISCILYIMWLHNYEGIIKEAYKKESQLIIWELQKVENTSKKVLSSISKLMNNYENTNNKKRIDYASSIFSTFIEAYDIIDGFKIVSSDSILLNVTKLNDSTFLRRIKYLNDTTYYSEVFSLDKKGAPKVIDRILSIPMQKEDTNWMYNEQYYFNNIAFSKIFISNISGNETFEIAFLDDNNTDRMLGIEISLKYLANLVSMLESEQSYSILCDHFDNIILLGDRERVHFQSRAPQNLAIRNKEMKIFLANTFEKDYYPHEFISFYNNKTKYLGNWTLFSFGNKTLKLGYLTVHDNKLWIIWIILVLFSVIGFLFYYLNPRISNKIVKKRSEKERKIDIIEDNEIKSYEIIYKKLLYLFNNKKTHLDPNSSLGSLSDIIGCDRSILSRVIQLKENKTAKELINDFRIKDAVEFIKKDKSTVSLSIDFIAEKYGYKSRTSFHREFNKRMNYSPSEFIHLYHSQK